MTNSQSPSARRPLTPMRRRLFRAAAVVCGLLPVVLIEVVLRCAGIGHDLRLVVPVPKAIGWYRLNPRFDGRFYGQSDLSGPEPRPFRLPKPKGTRRILVVGGSTVFGFPYSSELSFPRHLEMSLRAQAKDGEAVEVLNAGITALNTSAEVAVVAEGLKADPDVIVVYTGHNEFYGPGGVASSAAWLSASRYRTIAWWRQLYMVQAIARLMTPNRPSMDLIESLPGDLHIPLDGDTFQKAVARFDENLTAMVETARTAGVPIVFVGPVANEHHQPPIEDLRADATSAGESEWREKLRLGERQLLWGDKTKAVKLLEAAKSLRASDPLIRFRLAQAYEKTGRTGDAVEQFQQALELDGCRFRAPSAFRATMKEVAMRNSDREAWFVDLHAAICRDDVVASPGRKHFLEHVHFTWEGNRVVADAVAWCVWEQVWSRSWSLEHVISDSTARRLLAVQPEDHVAALSLALMIYQRAPFRDGADSEKLAKELAQDAAFAFTRLSAERQSLFEKLTPTEMGGELISLLIRKGRSNSSSELFETWLRASVIRQPWNNAARSDLVNWLRDHGNFDEANRIQSASSDWPSP